MQGVSGVEAESSFGPGLTGALPIPEMVNEVLYVDFVSLEEWSNFDYVLTIVDGLSRYAQFVPCTK